MLHRACETSWVFIPWLEQTSLPSPSPLPPTADSLVQLAVTARHGSQNLLEKSTPLSTFPPSFYQTEHSTTESCPDTSNNLETAATRCAATHSLPPCLAPQYPNNSARPAHSQPEPPVQGKALPASHKPAAQAGPTSGADQPSQLHQHPRPSCRTAMGKVRVHRPGCA